MIKIIKFLGEFYYWVKWQIERLNLYVFMGDFRKKHFLIAREGNQIKIVVKNHHPFIREKQRKINHFLKNHTEEESIRFALKEALDGCTYIHFEKNGKLVNFWMTHGNIEYILTHGLLSDHKPRIKYHYPVLGLLAEFDFVRDTIAPSLALTLSPVSKYYTYKMEVSPAYTRIIARFHKRVDQATDFTLKVLREIYKEKKARLKIEVG